MCTPGASQHATQRHVNGMVPECTRCLQELAKAQLGQIAEVRASSDIGPFAAQAATWEDDLTTISVSLGQLAMCQVHGPAA